MTDPGYPILEWHNPACSLVILLLQGSYVQARAFSFLTLPHVSPSPPSVLLCYDTPGSIHLTQHLLPPKAAAISPPALLLGPPGWSSYILSCSPNNLFPMQLREESSFVKKKKKKESQLLSLTEFLSCLPKAPRIKFKLITASQLHLNWSLPSSQASLPIIPPPPQFYVALSLTFFLEHSSLVSACHRCCQSPAHIPQLGFSILVHTS